MKLTDPLPASSGTMAVEALVERIAQWLHDETDHPESYHGYTWPETDRDDGQRDDGWVKIVPLHAQAYFRDIAKRLVRQFAALAPTGETRRPNWSDIYKDAVHTADRDQELIAVTRETLRLAKSALQYQNSLDYYDNNGNAVKEISHALDGGER
jgi:hypothetical protein